MIKKRIKSILIIVITIIIFITVLAYENFLKDNSKYPIMHHVGYFKPKGLDYPIGRDTSTYWSNGKYQVVNKHIIDFSITERVIRKKINEKNGFKRNISTKYVFWNVDQFVYKNGIIYALGFEGYLYLNLLNDERKIFELLSQVPTNQQSIYMDIESGKIKSVKVE